MAQVPPTPSSPLARQVPLSSGHLLTPGGSTRSQPISPSATSLHSTSASPSPSLSILRILLIRHGLSEDNQNRIWAGHRDSALTATGVSQAKALGAALASCSLAGIYSSDLKRASRTAEEILAVNRTVPPPTLVQTHSLREQNFGKLEGMPYEEAQQAYSATVQSAEGRSYRFPEAETLDEVNARVAVPLRRFILPRLQALRTSHDRTSEPQVAIVAHGVAIAEILRYLMNIHDASEGSPWQDPRATYQRVRLDNTGWTLVELAAPNVDAETDAASRATKTTYVRIIQQNVTDHLHNAPLHGTSSPAVLALATVALSPSADIRDVRALGSASAQQRKATPYDARHLARELERAGASACLLPGTPGGRSNAQGQFKLSSSASYTNLANSSEAWQAVCINLLPLFNDGDATLAIEEINDHVVDHINRSLERSPARALDSLSRDLYALSSMGMMTINARLDSEANTESQLLESLASWWKRFYSRILPWLEGSLLPLQTNPTLLSLSKNEDDPTSSLRTERIDIRRIVLTAFRDKVILPRSDALTLLFLQINLIDANREAAYRRSPKRRQLPRDDDVEESLHASRLYPRLLQLINIVCGVLSEDNAQASMQDLEKSLKAGHASKIGKDDGSNAASGEPAPPLTAPRSKRTQVRQGWLPRSAAKHGLKATPLNLPESDDEEYGVKNLAETTRRLRVQEDPTFTFVQDESAFLSSLRSPEYPPHNQLDDSLNSTPTRQEADTRDVSDPTFQEAASSGSRPSTDQLPYLRGGRDRAGSS